MLLLLVNFYLYEILIFPTDHTAVPPTVVTVMRSNAAARATEPPVAAVNVAFDSPNVPVADQIKFAASTSNSLNVPCCIDADVLPTIPKPVVKLDAEVAPAFVSVPAPRYPEVFSPPDASPIWKRILLVALNATPWKFMLISVMPVGSAVIAYVAAELKAVAVPRVRPVVGVDQLPVPSIY